MAKQATGRAGYDCSHRGVRFHNQRHRVKRTPHNHTALRDPTTTRTCTATHLMRRRPNASRAADCQCHTTDASMAFTACSGTGRRGSVPQGISLTDWSCLHNTTEAHLLPSTDAAPPQTPPGTPPPSTVTPPATTHRIHEHSTAEQSRSSHRQLGAPVQWHCCKSLRQNQGLHLHVHPMSAVEARGAAAAALG